ncbi:hypothetical protein IQ22_01086 [Pseudomonas duriflava]|uniref:Uncharacterized protein n=1 Tax=Pseudomonas duriflava TaxID=459528 RepID=A0A562QIR4_9PSED|nr:hypothetical protein [Pseudomonas duriflava]TWI56634.1 hypothetical protein IQ22_01086 [Pseudomonas duriflava]
MKRSIFLLTALTASLAAHADSYRLAYSKTENVEVFIDHASGQAWCSPDLALRFVYGSEPAKGSIERLMPKLGGLLASQCSEATRIHWQSTDTQGKLYGHGDTAKASAWALTSGAATDVTAPASVIEKSPALPQEATVAAQPQPPTTEEHSIANAPAALPEEPDKEAAMPVSAVNTQQAALPIFEVSGWRPELAHEGRIKADFLTDFRDQQGCVFRLPAQQDANAHYLSAQSKGIGCSADGFAEGNGKISLVRSDGKKQSEYKGFFHKGLLFNSKAPDLPFIGFDNEHNGLYLLDSDADNKLYVIWQIPYQSYFGAWNAQHPNALIVTENKELFRQLSSIQAVIDRTTQHLDQMGIRAASFDLLAVRDLKKATEKSLAWNTHERREDYWLYQTSISYNKRGGFWHFNPNHSTNYLFRWEERQARRQAEVEAARKREMQHRLEQAGYEAQRQLIKYEELRREALEHPAQLVARQVNDVSYRPGANSGYSSMMQGGSAKVSLIAHLDGKSGESWRLDYPYEAELSVPDGIAVDEGWYFIQGKETLDSEKQDEQDLPLARIEAATVMACKNKGCGELSDPLTLMRLALNDPQWSPDEARETVNKAWPGKQQESR